MSRSKRTIGVVVLGDRVDVLTVGADDRIHGAVEPVLLVGKGAVAGPAAQAPLPNGDGPVSASPVMHSANVIAPVEGLRSRWMIASSC